MSNSKNLPPKWAMRFLKWFCHYKVVESLMGDLLEMYARRREDGISKLKADTRFILEVLDVCRPFAWKRMSNNSNYTTMVKKNVKVAWRNLMKDRMYSSIKVGGFAVGIAAFILISLFIKDELSYDKHYKKGNRIYRLLNDYRDPASQDEKSKGTAFPAQIADVLRRHFPEVEQAARMIPYNWFDAGNSQFRRADRKKNNFEEGFAYADPELLEILEVPMVYGDRSLALSEPNSIVLSRSKAEKYFPDEDPIGKLVVVNEGEDPYVIGGVMEDFPSNHHLQFDFFLTLTEKEFWPGEQTNWCCWNYNPYVLLKEGADPKELEDKLLLIRDEYVIRYLEQQGDAGIEDTRKYFFFLLQSIEDIHLYSSDISHNLIAGDIRIVRLFVIISILILLLASINFINLSTAKSANRAKEVGLRKVVGSTRNQLIAQFLVESTVYTTLAVSIGGLISWLLLPAFNLLTAKTLTLTSFGFWSFPILIVFIGLVSLFAGLYPAFYLSAFRPIRVLRGELRRGSKSAILRNVLVIVQFTISISLIVGAVLIHKQMGFILNKDLGFNKDQVLVIQGLNSFNSQKIHLIKNELSNISQVETISFSNYLPVADSKRDMNPFWIDGRSEIDKSVLAQRWSVGIDYMDAMGMKLIAGRNFTEMASDTAAIIINETMAKRLNLEDPVGKKIMNWETYEVIGLVEDFNFDHMTEEISPLSLVRGTRGSNLIVKIHPQDIPNTIAAVTKIWDELVPQQSIRYTFLDTAFAKTYSQVARTVSVFTAFSILAIFIACLGLFGLSAFIAEQRSKEISIRKALGASIAAIFNLFSIGFVKLVVIAFIIATPVSWLLMNAWLEDFKYRVDIEWYVFVMAGISTALIALMTVSVESLKAAFNNPVKGLRSE